MRNTELDVEADTEEAVRYEYFKLDEEKKLRETFAFFAKRITILSVVVYAISKYFNAF